MESVKVIIGLAEAIAQQLQAGNGQWRVDVMPGPEGERERGRGRTETSDDAGELEGEPLHAELVFEGSIAGSCSLQCEASQARGIAGGIDPELWLHELVKGCCEPLAAALHATYGAVQVGFGEEKPPSELVEAFAWLVITTDQGETVQLTLLGDEPMRQSLERFERVAAAAASSGIKAANLSLVMDVELNVSLRFGERQLSLREIMELASGSVVELDREVDEPVELILDGRVIARGEAVIVDGNYGIRVTEVLQPAVA